MSYSTAELDWIEAHSRENRRETHAAFCRHFGRDDVSLTNLNALCKRKGWMTGRTGCFEKGQTPFNKGKKCPPGKGGNSPKARRTQFRKGNLTGAAKAKLKAIGAERISKDGYLERKVHDGMPMHSRWRAVHLLRWEAVNGPLPEGHCLKCLDGDRLNTAPDNWKAIPRSMLPYLNGHRGFDFDGAPPELRNSIMAVAELRDRRAKVKGGDA